MQPLCFLTCIPYKNAALFNKLQIAEICSFFAILYRYSSSYMTTTRSLRWSHQEIKKNERPDIFILSVRVPTFCVHCENTPFQSIPPPCFQRSRVHQWVPDEHSKGILWESTAKLPSGKRTALWVSGNWLSEREMRKKWLLVLKLTATEIKWIWFNLVMEWKYHLNCNFFCEAFPFQFKLF